MLIDEQDCIARARRIIDKMGGVAAVARICGRSKGRVYSWTYPKAQHGTGGLIPAECQLLLVIEAQRSGQPLRAEDFFPDWPQSEAA